MMIYDHAMLQEAT
jgi:hypothetical protein